MEPGMFPTRRQPTTRRERTMAVRHRADRKLRPRRVSAACAIARVRVDHVGRVEHADAVGAMGAVKDERLDATSSVVSRLARHVLAHGDREAPVARTARVRALARLDAVDRTRPLGEADVVRAIRRPRAARGRPARSRSGPSARRGPAIGHARVPRATRP